jgi:hypothetical protein
MDTDRIRIFARSYRSFNVKHSDAETSRGTWWCHNEHRVKGSLPGHALHPIEFDVALTGTPEGVALSGRFPYLSEGDVVEVEIEGVCRLPVAIGSCARSSTRFRARHSARLPGVASPKKTPLSERWPNTGR